MHLYIIARGIKHELDRFISELSAKYLPFKFHGEDKLVQVAVRPIQLYEIVFPKEHLSSVINSLGGEKALQGQDSVGFLKKYVKWFRKFMHLEKIENLSGASIIPIYRENVEIIALGIKPDKDFPDGTEYL